jgi:flagellar P-ring protein precursor FlgI
MVMMLAAIAPDRATADDARPAGATIEEGSVVIGVGLVIGLPGTGDAAVDETFVETSIVGVLRRAGLDLWRGQIKPGRIAKVMVTAELPADAADGTRVAVGVAAIGDATSLAGGTLLATPLRDEDGRVYTVGQGRVEVGNQVADAELSEQPGIATRVGVLANGALLDADRVALD